MKSSRFTAMHVHIFGIVAVVLVLIIVYFAGIRPKNQDTVTAKAAADTADQGGGNPAAKSAAEKGLKTEKQNTVQIDKDWHVYADKYMPNLKMGKDPLYEYYYGKQINEMPTKWGNWVTQWYDAQRKQGVERGGGQVFPVPSIAADPNGIASLTSITFPSKDPWKVNVTCKSFDQAMAHLRRFNGMEHYGMPVINNVSISGQSPELQLNYTLALYVIPNEPPPAADPRIAGGSGANNGGGGGNMMMGGGMTSMMSPGSGGMGGKGGK